MPDEKNNNASPPAPVVYPGFLSVFPSLMVPMFLAVADQTIVATALPAIAAGMGNVQGISWIVIAYLMAATVAAPIYGRLGDTFGRRRLMFAALTVFITASALCAVAPTIEWLTAARVLQGFGGGGLMTLSQALIGESAPPRERARYQGYIAAVAVTANGFGPVAGGFLTEHFGWRSIFLVSVPIGLIAFALTFRIPTARRSEPREWRADPGGLFLFTVFVVATLVALDQFKYVSLAALPLAGALFAAGMIALVLLVRHENRAASPLIPLALLRMPAIWRSDAMAALHGAALVSLITFLPVYLQAVRGASPSETGLVLVPLTVGIGTGAMVTGRLMHKTGLASVFPAFGLVLVTANFVVLAFWAHVLGTTGFALLMLWNGLFMGTVMGVVQVTVQTASGPHQLGEAAATVQFSRSIGAAFGTAFVAVVLFGYLALKNPEAARVFAVMVEHAGGAERALAGAEAATIRADIAQAFRAAFLVMALFTTGGFVLAVTHPMRRL